MNANRNGIEVEKNTLRWFEALAPVAVPVIAIAASLWVSQAVYAEKFSNQQQRIAQIEMQLAKQDDRMTAIYQALADIRSGVAEIKGRLQHMETLK